MFSSPRFETWQPLRPAKGIARKRSNLNGHAVPVCKTGKLRFRSLEQAQQSLTVAQHARATAWALGRDTNRREIRVYGPCPRCNGGYHTTSQPLLTGVVVR